MNKNIFTYAFIFIAVTAVFISCKKTTPTAGPQNTATITRTAIISPTATITPTQTASPTITETTTITPTATVTSTANYGIITGNLVLPGAQSGYTYEVLVDTDLNFSNGIVNMAVGLCGGSANVPYSVTVPAGSTYFVYAVVKTVSPPQFPPQAGDYVGVCGILWPATFGAPYVTVVDGLTTASQDITMVLAADNVHGTLDFSSLSAQDGKQYLIMLDDDGNGGNGGVSYLNIKTIPGGTGTSLVYGALCLFPGSYHITAQIDVNSSGLPGAPNGGDYVQASGPFTMDPTISNGPYDMSLIAIP
jgi:hypothetical protein